MTEIFVFVKEVSARPLQPVNVQKNKTCERLVFFVEIISITIESIWNSMKFWCVFLIFSYSSFSTSRKLNSRCLRIRAMTSSSSESSEYRENWKRHHLWMGQFSGILTWSLHHTYLTNICLPERLCKQKVSWSTCFIVNRARTWWWTLLSGDKLCPDHPQVLRHKGGLNPSQSWSQKRASFKRSCGPTKCITTKLGIVLVWALLIFSSPSEKEHGVSTETLLQKKKTVHICLHLTDQIETCLFHYRRALLCLCPLSGSLATLSPRSRLVPWMPRRRQII